VSHTVQYLEFRVKSWFTYHLVLQNLVQELDKGKHKPNFIELIDEIVSLSVYYDDIQVADALCNITTVTKAHYVRFHAQTVNDKIKG
jgi:hypothetical protein